MAPTTPLPAGNPAGGPPAPPPLDPRARDALLRHRPDRAATAPLSLRPAARHAQPLARATPRVMRRACGARSAAPPVIAARRAGDVPF